MFDYTVAQWGLPQAMHYTDLTKPPAPIWLKPHSGRRAAVIFGPDIGGAASSST